MRPDPPPSKAPACYQMRVDGHPDDRWSTWFDDLVLTRERDGTTSLTGSVTDQSHLHGLLSKVRDLGVTLISLEATSPPDQCRPQDKSGDGVQRDVEKALGA